MEVGVAWRTVGLVAVLSATACKKQAPLPSVAEAQLLEQLRDRPVPDPVQARFSIKMRSDTLKIHAPRLGGGLVVDRPDRAYLAVLDPLGSPVITLSTDGDRVVFVNNRDRQYVAQDDVRGALGTAARAEVRIEDLTGLLLGLLPVEDAQLSVRETTPEGLHLVFTAPGGIEVDALIDPDTATPRRVSVHDAQGAEAVIATYEPYQIVEGLLLPTAIVLRVPSVDLDLDLRFKTWRAIPEAPDVFSPVAPASYEVITFREFVDRMGETVSDDAGGDAPPQTE